MFSDPHSYAYPPDVFAPTGSLQLVRSSWFAPAGSLQLVVFKDPRVQLFFKQRLHPTPHTGIFGNIPCGNRVHVVATPRHGGTEVLDEQQVVVVMAQGLSRPPHQPDHEPSSVLKTSRHSLCCLRQSHDCVQIALPEYQAEDVFFERFGEQLKKKSPHTTTTY